MATQNDHSEAQTLSNQVITPYLAYEIAHALSPMCTSADQFVYMKQIVTETIDKHIKWVKENEADTKVTTTASTGSDTTTKAEKNANNPS